jgi:hypothetical protein
MASIYCKCGRLRAKGRKCCAQCGNAYQREWRKTHSLTEEQRVSHNANCRKWYLEHREDQLKKGSARATKWRKEHPAEYQAYKERNRERAARLTRAWYRAHLEESRKKGIIRSREWAKTHPNELRAQVAAYVQKRRRENPKVHKKEITRAVTKWHLRTGKLEKNHNCEVCESSGTQCHHLDYSQPLDVVWLCKFCHKQLHDFMKKLMIDLKV